MLVDDEPAFRYLMRMILEDDARYEVVAEAGDGLEAIEMAARHKPDAVLLDLNMPRMGGLAALPKIRTASPKSRILVLSVVADQGPLHAAKMAGADGFIDKVLDNDDFLVALDECLVPDGWKQYTQRTLTESERHAKVGRRLEGLD